jgi:O-antigen/teichoic acid export membrane protein
MREDTLSTDTRRKRLILLAYITSGGSKVFTLAIQLVALPMAAWALSAEKFGALFVLAAIASFLSIAGQGFSPSISFIVSDSRGRDEGLRARKAAWTMLAIGTLTGAFVLVLGLLGSVFADPVLLVGRESRPFASELRWGVAAMAVHVAALYAFGYVEGVRAAYFENHITNLFTAAGSIGVLLAAWLASRFWPTVGAFYLAIYAVPVFFQGLNLAAMLYRRRADWGKPVFDRGIFGDISSRALNYSWAQLGTNLFLQGTVYVAAQIIGLQASALLGATMRFLALTMNCFRSLLTPIFPTLSHGLAMRDVEWVHRTTRWILIITLAGSAFSGLTLAVGGKALFHLWLGLAFPGISLTALSLGLAGASYMSSSLIYMVLMALDDPSWASIRILVAGIVGTSLGTVGALLGGLAWLVAMQAIAMFLLAAMPICLRLSRKTHALQRMIEG